MTASATSSTADRRGLLCSLFDAAVAAAQPAPVTPAAPSPVGAGMPKPAPTLPRPQAPTAA